MKKPTILLDVYIRPKLSEHEKDRLKPDFGNAFFDIAKDFEWSAKSLKSSTKVPLIFYDTLLKKKYRQIEKDMLELSAMIRSPVNITWKARQTKRIIPPVPEELELLLSETHSLGKSKSKNKHRILYDKRITPRRKPLKANK